MSYISIVVAILFGVFIVTIFGSVIIESATPRIPAIVEHTASSTPSVTYDFSTTSPISLESETDIVSITHAHTMSVTKKDMPPAVKVVPATAPPAATNVSLDVSASALRRALVNIICYVPAGSGLHSISGSGVIVDPKGIILTNAHIAQYFLLADRGVSCIIRSGSPAIDSYDAALIYISPAWINANANVLTQAEPSGTGEYDFAFLAVTKSATGASLPLAHPFLSLATIPLSAGAPVVIASYGAQFLETNQIRSALFPTVVFGSVKDVFTFATSSVDVLSLGGSAAAQEGSSGGGVADVTGSLVGTITTSTTQGATATRSLSAVTASYIRFEYSREMGSSLELLFAEPTEIAIAEFIPQIHILESIITAHLPDMR